LNGGTSGHHTSSVNKNISRSEKMASSWSNIRIRGKLLIGFGLISLIFIASSLYTLRLISTAKRTSTIIAEQNAPAWDAVMEIKVGLVTGHLWLAESLAGDDSITDEEILKPWDEAIWHADALLDGGKKEGVTYAPMENREIRKELNAVTGNLNAITELAQKRLDAYKSGSLDARAEEKLDQAFETRFATLTDKLTGLETSIGRMIAEDNRLLGEIYASEYREIILSLVLMVALSAAIALLFSHYVVAMPLKRITGFVKEVAEGRLTDTIDINSGDEFGVMAAAVNTMVERLSGLVSQVQRAGIQVSSSVTEIAASTKEHEATATEHAATTSEVAASVQEIAATSKDLGKSTGEVFLLARETSTSASEGQELIAELDSTMNRLSEASQSIGAKLTVLSEKTGKISTMVTTINKVAEQTNLLSLNAAIEAEKAGEYGRGFSVVATEIRRLADQTAVSTFDIEQIVAEVQSAVSAGVMSMDKFSEEIHRSVEDSKKLGEQLERIVEQVQALAPHVESVNEGLQAQSDGASQINDAMRHLSEAAQQTADFVRQSNNAIIELNNAARGLKEGVSIFKLKDVKKSA
jgi:methyl-accepting chemotaxis protein WspA